MYSARFSEPMIWSHEFSKIQNDEESLPVPGYRQPQVNVLVCFQVLLYKDKQAVISSTAVIQTEYATCLILHCALSNQKYILSVISYHCQRDCVCVYMYR